METIGQIGLPVQDLKRASKFYAEKLGLPFLFSTDRMAFFECGTTRLMLSLPEHEVFAANGSVIYFDTADIHKQSAELEAAGVPFTGKPHCVAKTGSSETWLAFFSDPDGNHLALMSEVASHK